MDVSFKKKKYNILIIPWLAISILLLLGHSAIAGELLEKSLSKHEIKLIWSANYDQGEQIYFSSYENNTWHVPLQISDSRELAFHATVAAGDDGKVWAVWSSKEKGKNFLEWSVSNDSKWSKPRQIDTGLTDNKAATIIIDTNNIPWIAWTGVNKRYPDIYWSRWTGEGWDSPKKAHADNNVPDLGPMLVLDDLGRIILSWETFENGQYVTAYKMWDGRKWQQKSHLSATKKKLSLLYKSKQIPGIPKFVKDPNKVSYFIKGTTGAGTIPPSNL